MSSSLIPLFGLIGAIIGAVPGLLGAIIPWLRDKDRVAQKKRDLEVAKLEVELIAAWIDAISKVPDQTVETLKSHARTRLLQILDTGLRAPDVVGSAKPVAAQAAVHIIRPWATRISFYTYLGFYVFLLLGASIDDAKGVSLSHLFSELTHSPGSYTMVVLSIPLAILFWRWRLSRRIVPSA